MHLKRHLPYENRINWRKFQLLSLCLCFTLCSFGCKEENGNPPPETPVEQAEPQQYNVPFADVPDIRDVSLYQVNMRVFSMQGNLKGVTARLDNIKDLGVNAIYLMPIFPIGTARSINSPYCISDYLSVSPEMGSLADLRELVDAAHERGMAVLLDWVANHTSFDHAWTSNRNWYLQDHTGEILSPPGTGWNDVAQLNFSNSQVRQAMIKAMKYWVLEANIDGYRCDYSDGPPADFWKQAIDTLRNIPNRQLILMAEGERSANFSVGFDYNFGFAFYERLKSIYSNNQSVVLLDNLNQSEYTNASPSQQVVRYITNHDVNSSDGSPYTLFGGKAGATAAFVVAAYMKGVPMVYNGQEVGTPIRLEFPFTSNKIDWSLNPDVFAEHKKIIELRSQSLAIRRGDLTSYGNRDVCVFTKVINDERVLVLANLRNNAVTYNIPSPLQNTTWAGAFDGSTTQLGTTVSLGAHAYLVLKNIQ